MHSFSAIDQNPIDSSHDGVNRSYCCFPVTKTEKCPISLPGEHALYINGKVESIAFASASEVVRAGLRALQERDEAIERWLREDLAAAYDKMKADPSRGIPVDQVSAELAARHADRKKGNA
jgi:antitoxin ParD1/3/4